jgi:hypothetical protein
VKKINILMGIFLMLNMLMLTKAQSPGGISPQLWYKADAGITTSAGTVTQWNNSASALYNLVQQGGASTVPAYNTSQINFNPSVRFDGSDDRLSTATVPQNVITTAAAPFQTSQYVVYRKLGAAVNPLYSHSDGLGGTRNVGGNSNGSMLITNRSINTSPPTANEIRLQEIDGDSNTASTYLNGTLVSSTFTGATAAIGTQNFWVGAQGTTGFSNSDIAEIVIYNTTQSTGRPQIESYLALKYGITKSGNYVASNGTTNYWTAATNTGYNNNITGIARDDNSSLYQKQSMSINSGQQILIGLTGMANTNTANSGTLTDQQFLVVGDNGLAKVSSTAISGITGVNYRFSSVWKVQNTGSVGIVRVMWPQGLNNLKLVQNNSDATFTTGNTVTDMSANTQTINGIVYNYADVSLADGQFFTLAAQVYAPGGVLASLWYRADRNLTPATGSVTSWKDYSYGGVNLSPVLSASTSAPSAINGIGSNLNFNPGVSFVQANALGNSSNLNAITGLSYTIYTLTTAILVNTRRILGVSIAGLSGANKYDSPGIEPPNFILRNSGGAQIINTTLNPAYTPNSSVTRTSFTNTSVTRAQDGSAVGTTATFSGASVPNGGFVFGRNANDGGDDNGFDGTISETVVFDGTLSANQINRIDSYLAIKGGITLNAANTPDYLNSASLPIWTGSTNTGYQNNITGIGRDDLSDLNQKQSQSINAGSQVLIGIGGALANTNALNVNSFSANQQFVVWGDNGLARTPSVTISGISGTNYRFVSVWKVQNTGTVGAVRVMWPQGLNNLKLVQNNSDATFTTGNTVTDMSANTQTINGVVYNYADVTLTNGQYFTFAAFVQAPGGVINNLQVWNKADFGTNTTTEGGTVTSWNNFAAAGGQLQALSGFSLHTANSSYMNLGSNFNPTVRMIQGAGLGMLNAFSTNVTTSGTGGTFYNVSKAGAGGTPTLLYNVQMNVSAATLSTIGSSIGEMGPFINSATSSGMFVFPTNLTVTNFFNPSNTNILGLAYTTGTASAYPYKINGKNNAPSGSYTPSAFTGRNFHLNTDTDGGADRGGFDYQEVIGYERQITASEQNRIESYLAVKYGVTMDQTTATNYVATDASVIWNAATNAAYNQNIAGIGRDDLTALNQKQSQSINTGSQVLIGIGGAIANTNVLNANSFPTDKQYLIWGDNGLTKAPSVVISGITGVNYRFASVWKVQNTNTVGTVRVMWPQGLNNLKLVQNTTDPTFAASNTVTDMSANTQSVNGTIYNYADVSLDNGQYFTFAAFVQAPGGVVTNLQVWNRADFGTNTTTNAANVTTWNNSGFTGGQLQALSSFPSHPANPTYLAATSTSNFNPSVRMVQGAGLGMLNAFSANATTSGTGGTFFNVFKAGAGTSPTLAYNVQMEVSDATLTTAGSFLAQMGPFISNSTTAGLFVWNTGLDKIGSNLLNPSNTNISGFAYTTGVAAAYPYKVNGLGIVPNSYTPPLFAGRNFHLNTDTDGGPDRGGSDYQEVIGYERQLNSAEQNRVETYLAVKYGVTLGTFASPVNYTNTSGISIWSTAANSYQTNVIGIARDDFEYLHQRISKSQDATADIITISTNNDFTNANSSTNHTDIANDQFYFMTGNNGAATTYNVQNIMLRRWKVQTTGTAQNLFFKTSDTQATYLIYADDAGMTTNVVNVPLVSGATAGIQIPNGKFFTFAKFTYCTKDPNTSPADTITKIGITIQTKQNGWPENIPNGAVVLESKTKGFVITRTQSSLIANPVEGMLIYDTTDNCMKLYNGTTWKCVVRSCNE